MFSARGAYPGEHFIEAWAPEVEPAATDTEVRFINLQGFSTGGQSSDGWVDVRGCSHLVVLARATGQAATINVHSKRTILDDASSLVGPVSASAGSVTEVFNNSVSGVAYVRVVQKYTSASGGELEVSLLAE